MRRYFIHTVLGILLLAVAGMQLLAFPIVASPIGVSVKIKPETLNLKENKGGVITAFIEFNNSLYDVSDIDVKSIELHVKDGVGSVQPIRCIVADGKLVAKFNASEVADLILTTLGHMQPTPPQAKYSVIVVEGIVKVVEDMVKEEPFEGSDQIRIILP